MHLTAVLFALLPVLATAQLLVSNITCGSDFVATCAPSSDGVRRCLVDGSNSLCVVDCATDCRSRCNQLPAVNGFCIPSRNNSCICSNIDPGFPFP
ncbi:hypothetical protein LX36DRAFT_661490 [Colletotrichum falcatum]|nr:hypothetical protein LX36DRAFT_661490 [Colletotrichum falcatum]